MKDKFEYKPMTKKTLVDGKEKIICTLVDIEKCPIHNGCYSVRQEIFDVILEQLFTFEQIYMENEGYERNL